MKKQQRKWVDKSTIYYYNKCRPKSLYEKTRSKLPQKYIDYILKKAANKRITEISGRRLADEVNNKLIKDGIKNKNGSFLTISKSQVNRILRRKYGKTRKIRSVFYLNNTHKQKRIDFCKKLLKKGINGKNIFFTDETIIDLAPAVDSIRLTQKKREKYMKEKKKH